MDLTTTVAGASALTGASSEGGRCWCGSREVEPLRSDYAVCRRCGTVIYSEAYDPADYQGSGPSDFYGDRYWLRYVPGHLGLPELEERARADLPERAVYQLRRILEHLSPGARLLELGCGAGSLTYLLSQAGFDASGRELGPAAVELARRHFGIEVARGPLELAAKGKSFEAIVAVDVLEHLPDPLATLRHCAERLAGDGLLFLQTPRYRDQGPEWDMLLPREHLFLFTASSIERLLRAAGFAAVTIDDSFFPGDMWVVASSSGELTVRPDPLAGLTPIAVALIDACAEGTRIRDELAAVGTDRQHKERDNERLRRELEEVRQDQRAKEELIHAQDAEIGELREDRRRQGDRAARLEADFATRGEALARQASELEAQRRDRAVRGELIAGLSRDLEALRGDHGARGELIERLSAELEALRADQSDRGALITRLSTELQAVRADQQAKEQVIRRLHSELRAAWAELHQLRSDRLYRLGRWARAWLGSSQS